jgi:hypothetical protein
MIYVICTVTVLLLALIAAGYRRFSRLPAGTLEFESVNGDKQTQQLSGRTVKETVIIEANTYPVRFVISRRGGRLHIVAVVDRGAKIDRTSNIHRVSVRQPGETMLAGIMIYYRPQSALSVS